MIRARSAETHRRQEASLIAGATPVSTDSNSSRCEIPGARDSPQISSFQYPRDFPGVSSLKRSIHGNFAANDQTTDETRQVDGLIGGKCAVGM